MGVACDNPDARSKYQSGPTCDMAITGTFNSLANHPGISLINVYRAFGFGPYASAPSQLSNEFIHIFD